MEKQKQKFSDRCIKKGLSSDEISVIWNKIDKFSKYTWNLGHAVAYTRICYETAYLATHFPSQYYSACATNAKDADESYGFINAMKQRKLNVMPADINKSINEMVVLHDGVLLGLSGIKRVGDAALSHIISVRSGGAFSSIMDFYRRTKGRAVTSATLKALYSAGSFDNMPDLDKFHTIVGITEREATFLRINQYYISSRISIDPSTYISGITKLGDIASTGIVVCYVISVKEIYTKTKHELMAFLKLEDMSGCYEVVAFPTVWLKSKSIKEGVVVRAVIEKDKNNSLVLKYITQLTEENFDKSDGF
jgi:DNA polymerase III alpha subunit